MNMHTPTVIAMPETIRNCPRCGSSVHPAEDHVGLRIECANCSDPDAPCGWGMDRARAVADWNEEVEIWEDNSARLKHGS